MNPNYGKKRRTRIIGVGSFFGLFLVATFLRAYQLQVLGNVRLDRLVQSQYSTNIVLHPKRGTIYDRNGNVLAIDVDVATIAINPKQINDAKAVRDILLKNTSLNSKELDAKLSSEKNYEFIERRISAEKGAAIEAAKLKGVIVEKEFRRFYPNKELAGQLLGAVGFDAKALGGIELTYDEYLRSDGEKKKTARDARGKLFSWDKMSENYHDLYLTIDLTIQHLAEEALKEQAIKHKVRKGFAMVLDTTSGEILAMANYPAFNPNVYWDYPNEQWKNHAVIDSFEPGSTFKTLVLAAALDSKKVKPTDRFNCENGAMHIGKNIIRDSHGHGILTASEILKVSSNIGMTKIAFQVGKKAIYEVLKKFGIGEKTKLGLNGEPSGIFRNFEKWGDIEFSNIAFGQGLTVNGLQMLAAYSVIANSGDYVNLHLLKKIVSVYGDPVYVTQPRIEKQILTKETTESIKDMLHAVTQEGGTATAADLIGYSAAGKTGTAQMLDPNTKTYSDTRFMSSFIGFAPLDNPRLVVYVMYETQKGFGHFGGVVAAPAFKDIAQKSLTYLGVKPENIQTQTTLESLTVAEKDYENE